MTTPGDAPERSWGMVFLGIFTGIAAVGGAIALWVVNVVAGVVTLGIVAAFMLWAVVNNVGRGFGLGLVLGVVVLPIVAGGICFALIASLS